MLSVFDFEEDMEDITQLFGNFQNLPTIMKPSLVPRVPRGKVFATLVPTPYHPDPNLNLSDKHVSIAL